MSSFKPTGAVLRSTPLRLAQWIVAATVLFGATPRLAADVIFFSGNLRTDATVTACQPSPCTLGPSSSDADYAQFAAVVDMFTVYTPTTMEAISYSYGGGTSLTGPSVAASGLEPYLSLYDASGNFLASTFFGTTCPAGANSVGPNCFDVALDGGILTPGVYQITLTAFENMSSVENGSGANLSDGFTGLGSLQPGEDLNYAFDVILPQNMPLSTPEPGSMGLLAIACTALALRKCCRSVISTK
jgi:hypothetical protein